MNRTLLSVLTVVMVLGLIPFACVAKARQSRSSMTRIHVVPDMDNQDSYRRQEANAMFADGRAMRLPPQGTVARELYSTDEHLHTGIVNDDYVTTFPAALTVDMDMLERGRERYGIYCTPCHGLSGYGDGMVSRRAEAKQQGTWVPPTSFHEDPALTRPVGHIFNSITNGIRNMPAYGSQIPVADRWAIVSYVRALQRSQRASLTDVPAAERGSLR